MRPTTRRFLAVSARGGGKGSQCLDRGGSSDEVGEGLSVARLDSRTLPHLHYGETRREACKTSYR